MKKYWSCFICICILCSVSAQQKRQVITDVATLRIWMDGTHLNPYQSLDATQSLRTMKSLSEVSIALPLNDSIAVESIYHLIDSLAQTKVYINKKLANKVAFYYIENYSKNETLSSWQKDLITRLIRQGFKYCYRYIDDHYSIGILPASFYTSEIIESCKELYEHPVYTREEAEVLAISAFKTSYFVTDTIGFAALQHKKDSLDANFHKLDPYDRYLRGQEEDIYYKQRGMIRRAKEAGLSLEQYCDSMNRAYWQEIADRYTGEILENLVNLLSMFAKNKIYVMAPLIEEQGPKYFTHSGGVRTPEALLEKLAWLDYKDYPEKLRVYNAKQVADCTQQIDSLRQVLSTINQVIKYHENNNGFDNYMKLWLIYDELEHIGTQEAYFAMAPLLLIKNRVKDQYPHSDSPYIEIPIDVKFYNKIAHLLANVPLPKCVDVEFYDLIILYNNGECKEIEAYLPKVYQWMLDNKGKYELKE